MTRNLPLINQKYFDSSVNNTDGASSEGYPSPPANESIEIVSFCLNSNTKISYLERKHFKAFYLQIFGRTESKICAFATHWCTVWLW